jgi:hypothetical protein
VDVRISFRFVSYRWPDMDMIADSSILVKLASLHA